jgi:hypothetical protein
MQVLELGGYRCTFWWQCPRIGQAARLAVTAVVGPRILRTAYQHPSSHVTYLIGIDTPAPRPVSACPWGITDCATLDNIQLVSTTSTPRMT